MAAACALSDDSVSAEAGRDEEITAEVRPNVVASTTIEMTRLAVFFRAGGDALGSDVEYCSA
jgi:hypothetical protein